MKKGYLVSIIFLLVGINFTSRLSAAIVAELGEVNHFVISVPSEVSAGETFKMEIEARDIYSNPITNYYDAKREIEIRALGAGEFKPDFISSGAFTERGRAVIDCSYTKAEALQIIVKEKNSSISGSARLTVVPGKITYFEALFPPSASAGQSFLVKLTVKDANGNCVPYFEKEQRVVEISTDGAGMISPNYISNRDFKGGIAVINLTYSGVGNITFFFKENKERIFGKATVEMKAGRFHHFEIINPSTVIAGRAFKTIIKARDVNNNLITDYQKEGTGAFISTSGTGSIRPNFIPVTNFDQGIATVNFVYTKAEPFTIIVKEGLETRGVEETTFFKEERQIEKTQPKEIIPLDLQKPEEKSAEDLEKQEKINELKKQADRYVNESEYQKALEIVNKILALDPQNQEIKKLKGRLEEVIKLIK